MYVPSITLVKKHNESKITPAILDFQRTNTNLAGTRTNFSTYHSLKNKSKLRVQKFKAQPVYLSVFAQMLDDDPFLFMLSFGGVIEILPAFEKYQNI